MLCPPLRSPVETQQVFATRPASAATPARDVSSRGPSDVWGEGLPWIGHQIGPARAQAVQFSVADWFRRHLAATCSDEESLAPGHTAAPTFGHCVRVVGHRIVTGEYGEVTIDGLKCVVGRPLARSACGSRRAPRRTAAFGVLCGDSGFERGHAGQA